MNMFKSVHVVINLPGQTATSPVSAASSRADMVAERGLSNSVIVLELLDDLHRTKMVSFVFLQGLATLEVHPSTVMI
jgi:hypothetical protein